MARRKLHVAVSYYYRVDWFCRCRGGYVPYPCVALAAEWIDVDVVLAPDSNFFQLAAHFIILHFSEHTLENAQVHSRAYSVKYLHHLCPSPVVTDVVCDDIKMLMFHVIFSFSQVTILPRMA